MARLYLKQIYLYSPVRPMFTGTADYFGHVLESLRRHGLPTENVNVVVDNDMLSLSERRSELFGYPIVDYRSLPDVVESNEIRFMFVANNEFHSYIHRTISRLRKRDGGQVVSILHDVCCAMLLKHLSFNGIYGFSPDRFIDINRAQLGTQAHKFIEDRQAGNIPETFDFVTHAQGATLDISDEIWTHSRFGALKLVLESDREVEKLPTFRICNHPAYEDGSSHVASAGFVLNSSEAKAPGVFRFGIFGWASPPKRIYEALRSFRLLLARLERHDRERIELVVVGKLIPPHIYDPVGFARSLGIEERCRFFGFVSNEKFRALIDNCDCVLNLRFPSCGESSGSGSHARGSGVDIVMSSCQAFNEERATVHVEPLPVIEEFVLADAMWRFFVAWRDDETFESSLPVQRSRLISMEALLASFLWEKLAEDLQDSHAGDGDSKVPKEYGDLLSEP